MCVWPSYKSQHYTRRTQIVGAKSASTCANRLAPLYSSHVRTMLDAIASVERVGMMKRTISDLLLLLLSSVGWFAWFLPGASLVELVGWPAAIITICSASVAPTANNRKWSAKSSRFWWVDRLLVISKWRREAPVLQTPLASLNNQTEATAAAVAAAVAQQQQQHRRTTDHTNCTHTHTHTQNTSETLCYTIANFYFDNSPCLLSVHTTQICTVRRSLCTRTHHSAWGAQHFLRIAHYVHQCRKMCSFAAGHLLRLCDSIRVFNVKLDLND